MPSYYEALPIYKVAMDVAVRVDAVVQCFAKGHKYTLGGRLRETTLDVVMLIARLIERGLAQGWVAIEEPEACGNVKRRCLACLFERPLARECEQEKSK
jgi:hypothetical protein